jgi:hypothetical protein
MSLLKSIRVWICVICLATLTFVFAGDVVVKNGDVYTDNEGSFGSLIVDTDVLVVDADNDRVGIGTASPSASLDVNGDTNVDGTLTVDQLVLPVKSTSGDPTGTEGQIYVNTADNAVRVYADGAWRSITTW